MADTLEIFGIEYTNVAGIIATDDNGNDLTYTRGGGGLDIPTFTEIWSNNWETLISLTCDKTYNECNSYYLQGMRDAFFIIKTQDGSEEFKECIKQTKRTYNGSIIYTIFYICEPLYDLIYESNGTIRHQEPSQLNEVLNITQNDTYYPSGSDYISEVNVNVSGGTPTLQNKTVSPSESQQSIQADSGYDGLDTVIVDAISSTYVGSGIARKSSTDLTTSGATVTVPAGYYAEAASKSVSLMTLPTSAASSATSDYTSKATIGRSTAAQYINIPPGYNSAGAYYVISAVANGSATGPTSLSGSSATITTGTNTITLTKTGVSTTPTVSAGYVSDATASTATVALTASVTVNPTPTASGATVTIPAGYYSVQTTKSVTSGSATAPSSISGTAASVSTGTNTLTLTKTVSVTPTVSAGYVSSGTAGNSSVSLTASVTTKAAATITPTTTNQTIVAGTYLTGTQTIAGDADLVGSNILSTANIFGVQGTVVVQNYYTGSSAPSSSLGSNGDLYLQS